MRLNWPLKDMNVGDAAIIRGVPIGRAKQYIYLYSYQSGKKFISRRKTGADGATYLAVLRVNDDGTEPAPTGVKYRMGE
jgi:hypothetical protein